MIKHGYDTKANFENEKFSNNAWYLAIKDNKINHIGTFLNWGGQIKNNPYVLPHPANINGIFILSDGSRWTPVLLGIKYFGEHSKHPSYPHTSFLTLVKYGNPDLNIKEKSLLNKSPQNAISLLLHLYDATRGRPEEIFKFLIEHKANLTEGFKTYIESGGDPNKIIVSDMSDQKFIVSLLWLAIHVNDINTVKYLLSKNVEVNQEIDPYPIPPGGIRAKDSAGHLRGPHKPLYFALQQDDTAIADLLIEHGAEA